MFNDANEGKTHYNPVWEILGQIEALPTTFPDRESDEFDAGYRQAVEDIVRIFNEIDPIDNSYTKRSV